MNRLLRELAPISDDAWRAIEDEARRALRHFLVGRRLVDVVGPLGWQYAGSPATGAVEITDLSFGNVRVAQRRVQAALELTSPIELDREVLDAIERGAKVVDLTAVRNAARDLATAEDEIVFNGVPALGVRGLAEASPHAAIGAPDDFVAFPRVIAQAVAVLRAEGVDGPYAVAISERAYTGVVETTEFGGWPVLEHIRLITAGPVLQTNSCDGAVVVSQRGGDACLTLGGDAAIRYVAHDSERVRLALQESLTFDVSTPEAVVRLRSLWSTPSHSIDRDRSKTAV
jgi:uncharacterized linocin/CFP29 family protein